MNWKKRITKNKREGDKKTPIGTFNLENLYFRRQNNIRKDKVKNTYKFKNGMVWRSKVAQKYNKLIKIHKKIHHENYLGMIINTIYWYL